MVVTVKEWKEIPGYSGYKVSRYGEVVSYKSKEPRVLKPYKDRDGYLIYRITRDDGVKKAYKEHRIVANTYIPNPENLPQVNHINGDKEDNTVDNLEWCTNSHNIQHGWDTGLIQGSPYGIVVTDIHTGDVVSYFNGYDGLSDYLGLSKATLYEIVMKNKMLYEGFSIKVHRNADYTREDLYENRFLHRTINGRLNPHKWGNDIYDSLKSLLKDLGISRRVYVKSIEKGEYLGKPLKQITQYEYVMYE